jgi:hypothetical protein
MPYADEGIPPLDVYPAGSCWRKVTVVNEFLKDNKGKI